MIVLWNFPCRMNHIKLLLDQGLPRTSAELLRKSGIDTIHVGEVGYADAGDDLILQFGREKGYIVVTLDADFHALLALLNASEPSVIRIRIEGLRAKATADLLRNVLTLCYQDLERGAAVTVQENRIRVRKLPLSFEKS
jgi:predicted nuclease of predicted toxin-antitoxin system